MTRIGVDQSATVVRERDTRRLRAMLGVLGLAGLLVVTVLGYVNVRLQGIRASYELEDIRTLKSELAEHNRKLRLELASLRAFARVDGEARRLGFTAPAQDQVQLAREFGSSSEMAAAGPGSIRTVATAPPAGARPLARP